MTETDLPTVLEIERLSFPIPFTEKLFRMELNLRVARLFVARSRVREGRSPAVANDDAVMNQMGGVGRRAVSPPTVTDDRIVGYIDYWNIGPEIHLITFAVHPEWRYQGIGSRLLQFMMEDGRKNKVEDYTLDVRASNCVAIQLYEKFGFCQTGIRKKYYQDNNEDALILSCRVNTSD